MRIVSLVLCALLLWATVPLLAQDMASKGGVPCDLTGTWYGNSDPTFPFVWIIAPTTPGRFSSIADYGADLLPWGYTVGTPWIGEIVKTETGTFDSWAMAYYVWDSKAAKEFGVDDSLPEADVVHSHIEMIDCDSFTSTIDIYGAYFAFDNTKIPFVTPIDLSWLPDGGTLVETYHRLAMPTTPVRENEKIPPTWKDLRRNASAPMLRRKR